MSIKTTKTNAHLQRAMPKPLRKAGLHSIDSAIYADSTLQPADRQRIADARLRAMGTTHTVTPIRNSTAKGTYNGAELAPSIRPGAMDAAALPSGGYVEQAQRERFRMAALPFVPTRKRAKASP